MGPKPPPQQRAARTDTTAAAPSNADYASLAGDYYSDDVDATYHVTYRDGRLSYAGHHIPAQDLVPIGPDTFRAGDLTVRFERNAPGAAATAFTIGAGRALNFRFKRR